MVEHPTLRQRNRERTSEEIATAAFSLFAERGFDATTVEQIAASAGVSTRTFFRYFPTKEDVVFGDHAAAVARLRAALAEVDPSGSPLRRVRRAILATQNPDGRREREMVRARLVEEVPAVRARFYRLIEDFEDAVVEALERDLGPDEGAGDWARVVAGATFGALRGARRAAGLRSGADPRRLVETAFDVVEEGADRHLPSRRG
jgi:AcrR family transcriptional regulator